MSIASSSCAESGLAGTAAAAHRARRRADALFPLANRCRNYELYQASATTAQRSETMMAGILEVSWFLDWAIKLGLGYSKAVDAAVEATGKAVDETNIYLVGRSQGANRNREREEELVRLWSSASRALRRVDGELARLASMKSEYWLRPQAWKDHEAALQEIELANVLPKFRKFKGEPPEGYLGSPAGSI